MKEVGSRITRLRESLPCQVCHKSKDKHKGPHPFTSVDLQTAAERTDVSRETIRKLETGETVKLPTLIQVARGLGATPSDVTELICTWSQCLIQECAPELSDHIQIHATSTPSPLRRDTDAERLKSKVSKLTKKEVSTLLDAVDRPEVLRSIVHLNSLYESATERAR